MSDQGGTFEIIHEHESDDAAALKDAARWRSRALGVLTDELRKPPSERDESRIQEAVRQADRATELRAQTLEDPLSDSCKPLGAWGDPHWLLDESPPTPALLKSGDNLFVPAGKTGLLVASGGAGKTQALTQLALAIATGSQWLGFDVEGGPGRVLLVLGEEDRAEMMRRFRRSARALGINASSLVDLAESNLWAMPRYGLQSRLTNDDDGRSEFGADLLGILHAQSKKDNPWRCIILDPGSRFMGAEAEKDNAAATRFIEAIEELTQAPGNPAVIVAHHVSKSAASAETTNQGAARGASALVDGARFVLNLHEELTDKVRAELPVDMRGSSYPRLFLTKANYGPRADPMRLVVNGDGVRLAKPEELDKVNRVLGESAGSGQRTQQEKQPEQEDDFGFRDA